MMSKKMKRAVMESSSYGVFDDPKAMLKHHTLLQDYQDLHKESDGIRRKLDDAQLRKLRLLAEVRFLRQRHKCLLQLKSFSHPQGPKLAALLNRSRDQVTSKKEAKLPPLPSLKQNGRIQVTKEAVSEKTPDIYAHKQVGRKDVLHDTVLGLNHKVRVHSGKEAPSRKGASAFDLKLNERLHGMNDAVLRSTAPAFDLNQDSSYSGKEVSLPSRAPVFDLNEISIAEEEPQANFDQLEFEEPKRSLIQNVSDGDMNLLICRNTGEGTSRVGKRKISWQDPVALRV